MARRAAKKKPAKRVAKEGARKKGTASTRKRARGSTPRRSTKSAEAVRRADIAREAAKAAARRSSEWFDGLDLCREHLSFPGDPARLRVVDVASLVSGGTPWVSVGRIVAPSAGPTYLDLWRQMKAIRDDERIDREFNPQRVARIVLFVEGEMKRRRIRFEYTLAEIAPWEVAISRAVRKLDPDAPADESITARYFAGSDDAVVSRSTVVLETRIWLGNIVFRSVKF